MKTLSVLELMTVQSVQVWQRLDVQYDRRGHGVVYDRVAQVPVSELLPPRDVEFLLTWVRERFPRRRCPVHFERRGQRRRSRSFVPADCQCTVVLETRLVNVLDQMVKAGQR